MSKKKNKLSKVDRMKLRYEEAKSARVGEMILCPSCGNKHLKNQYNTTFCSRKCKDKYWNTVDPNKRCRKNDYYYSKILNHVPNGLPNAVYGNLDYRGLTMFCSENGIDPNLTSSKNRYYREVVLQNKSRMRGFESREQEEQAYCDESLGDESESFGCTLAICDICGLRADICTCGEC